MAGAGNKCATVRRGERRTVVISVIVRKSRFYPARSAVRRLPAHFGAKLKNASVAAAAWRALMDMKSPIIKFAEFMSYPRIRRCNAFHREIAASRTGYSCRSRSNALKVRGVRHPLQALLEII